MIILLVLFSILTFFFQWVYLKFKSAKKMTYIKVFSLLTLGLIYLGFVFATEETNIMTPQQLLIKVYRPIQDFLTLKGMS